VSLFTGRGGLRVGRVGGGAWLCGGNGRLRGGGGVPCFFGGLSPARSSRWVGEARWGAGVWRGVAPGAAGDLLSPGSVGAELVSLDTLQPTLFPSASGEM